MRQCDGKELPLGTYQLFQRVSPAEKTVWSNLMRGLSMREYKLTLRQFTDAYGLEKSTISERFIEASRKKLEELMSRSLAHLQICALLLDGTIFKGQHVVVAMVSIVWQESGSGPGTRGDRKCPRGQWTPRSPSQTWARPQQPRLVPAGRKPCLAGCHRTTCRRGRFLSALPGAQNP